MRKKTNIVMWGIVFIGILSINVIAAVHGQSPINNALAPLSYLYEDETINTIIYEKIEEKEQFEYEKAMEEILIEEIKAENMLALASVDDAIKEELKEMEEEEKAKKEQEKQEKLTLQEKAQQLQEAKVLTSWKQIFTNNCSKAENYEHSMIFKITAYCPCSACCGPYTNGITSTGKTAKQGRTIAVDPKVIPYGTKVKMGGHIFIAEDCGGAIKGNIIDLYLNHHSDTERWGVRYLKVSWNGGNKKYIEALSSRK